MARVVDYLTSLCETNKREELMYIPGWKYRVLKTMFGLMIDTIENHSTYTIPSCAPYKRYTRIARDALNFSSEDLHVELREVRDDVYLASPTEYPASAAEDVTKYLEDSSRPDINLSAIHAYLTNHLVNDNMDNRESIDTVNYTAVVVVYIHTLCQALCHGTSIVDRLKSDMELFKTIYVGHHPDVELDDSIDDTTPNHDGTFIRYMFTMDSLVDFNMNQRTPGWKVFVFKELFRLITDGVKSTNLITNESYMRYSDIARSAMNLCEQEYLDKLTALREKVYLSIPQGYPKSIIADTSAKLTKGSEYPDIGINMCEMKDYLVGRMRHTPTDDDPDESAFEFISLVVSYIHTVCQISHVDTPAIKKRLLMERDNILSESRDEPAQMQEPVKSTLSKANQDVRHMIASHARERASEGDNCLIAHCVGPTVVITDVCTDNTRRMDSQIDDLIEVASSKGYNISLGGITYIVEPKE